MIKHPCHAKKWNPTLHYANSRTWFESVAPVNVGSTVISKCRTLIFKRDCPTRLAYQIAPPDTTHRQRPKYQAAAPGGARELQTSLRTVGSLQVVMFGTSRRPHRSRGFFYIHQLTIAPVYGSSIRYAVSRSPPVHMLSPDWRQLQRSSGWISGKSSHTISTLLENRTARCRGDTTMPPRSGSRDS